MEKKKKRLIYKMFFILLCACAIVFAIALAGQIIKGLRLIGKEGFESEAMVEFLKSIGTQGAVLMGFLSALQIPFTFFPAEPLQMISGLCFGFWHGTIICLIGAAIGNSIMYLLMRLFGDKYVDKLIKKVGITIDFKESHDKIVWGLLFLYVMPIIPYSVLCCIAGATKMRFWRYFCVTTSFTTISLCVGTGLGALMSNLGWIVAIVVLVVCIIVSIICFANKSKIIRYFEKKFMKSPKD